MTYHHCFGVCDEGISLKKQFTLQPKYTSDESEYKKQIIDNHATDVTSLKNQNAVLLMTSYDYMIGAFL